MSGLRCPIEACAGRIFEFIENENIIWGCAQCCTVWYERSILDKDISDIVKKIAYRRQVYVNIGDSWEPLTLESEPRNYEELVDHELIDQ